MKTIDINEFAYKLLEESKMGNKRELLLDQLDTADQEKPRVKEFHNLLKRVATMRGVQINGSLNKIYNLALNNLMEEKFLTNNYVEAINCLFECSTSKSFWRDFKDNLNNKPINLNNIKNPTKFTTSSDVLFKVFKKTVDNPNLKKIQTFVDKYYFTETLLAEYRTHK